MTRQRFFLLAFVASTGLVAFGLMQRPLFPEEVAGESFWDLGFLTLWAISLAPFCPMLAVLIKILTPIRLNHGLALVLGGVLCVCGGFIIFLAAAFSGGGFWIVLMHGVALTSAVVISIVMLSETTATLLQSMVIRFWLLPLSIALWSLLSVPAIAVQAYFIADGRPFCLSPHDQPELTIHSFAQLRGLFFYTASSSLDPSARQSYFHGLLLIDRDEIYNWSPRFMTFHRLNDPGDFVSSPVGVCQPKANFLGTLSIF